MARCYLAGIILLLISLAAGPRAFGEPTTGETPADSGTHKGLFDSNPGDKDSPLPPTKKAAPPPRDSDRAGSATTTPPTSPDATPPEPASSQPAAAAPPARLAPPAAAAREQAAKIANDLFKDDIARANRSDLKLALSQKLLSIAVATNDDPAGRFVLLEMARDQAVDAVDAGFALRAIAQLDQSYAVDALAMDADVVSRIFRKATIPYQLTALVDQVLPLTEQAVTAERFDLARQWADLARTCAQKAHDAGRVAAANGRVRDISAAEVKAKLIARSVAALKANPNDPDTNLAVGLFRCVNKNDWQSGLPLLSHGSDPALRALAEDELKSPADAEAQMHLANGWWDQAEKVANPERNAYRQHSAAWYSIAQPHLSGLSKALAERRGTEAGPIEVAGATPTGKVNMPPSKPIAARKPVGTQAATGPAHSLLKQPGAGGGLDGWKMTDEGMLIGTDAKALAKPFAWYTSGVVPTGEYDLHVVATVKETDQGASLRFLLPPAKGGRCFFFDIVARSDTSSDAGFLPSDKAQGNGANQFRGTLGSRMNIGVAAGQTLDFTIRMRSAGVTILVGGNPSFECHGFEDIYQTEKITCFCLKATHDSFLVRKFELIEALPAGESNQPPSKSIDVEKPDPTPAATGPVHNLLKPVGTQGGPETWKTTDEGLLLGDASKYFGFYSSKFPAPCEYDLHVLATVTDARDKAALRLLLPPPQGGPCWAFDINERSDGSCDAGFAPSGDARRRGADQFRGSFGSRMKIGLIVGQTFDLTIRVRNTGLVVFVGGKQWFARKSLDDLSESDIQKDKVCIKATLDSFLVHKLELIEVP